MDFLHYLYKLKIFSIKSNKIHIKETNINEKHIGNRTRSDAIYIPEFTMRYNLPNGLNSSKKIIMNDINFGRPLTKNLLKYIHKNFNEQEKLELIIEYNTSISDYNAIIDEYQSLFRKK